MLMMAVSLSDQLECGLYEGNAVLGTLVPPLRMDNLTPVSQKIHMLPDLLSIFYYLLRLLPKVLHKPNSMAADLRVPVSRLFRRLSEF